MNGHRAEKALDILVPLVAQRASDGEGEEDTETDLVAVCFSALLDGSKRHECMAEKMKAVSWPRGGKGRFGFELEQVASLLKALQEKGIMDMPGLRDALLNASDADGVKADASCGAPDERGVSDSLESLD